MRLGTDCLADAVELKKLSLEMTPSGPRLTAIFALVNSKKKLIVAWRKKSAGWSAKQVGDSIKELVKVLEGVAAAEVFANHEEDSTPTTISDFLSKTRTEY